MKNIKWGIYGLGKIAHKFVNDLKHVDGCQLYSVCSSDPTRALDFAKKHKAEKSYSNIDDFLADTELDVVYVAAEHVRHHPATIACLKAKKAVLCEKPFAMNGTQVAEMLQMAKGQKVFLMEALWSRFMPTVQKAVDWIHRGKIGEVMAVNADFGFVAPYQPDGRLFNKNLGGGALLDIGIYPIFLAYLVLGMPSEILATATNDIGGADVSTSMIFKYKSGAVANLSSTFMAETKCEGLIYGTKGRVQLNPRWHESTSLSLHTEDLEVRTKEWPRPNTYGYEYEIDHVNDCLRKGLTESTLWNHKDSENLIKLLDLVRDKINLNY